VVVLDLEMTPELEAEGLARDLVRLIQQARRDAGFDVSDRISLSISGSEDWIEAGTTHRDLIAAETLATSISFTFDDGSEPTIAVAKA
jgi:isoleucyl-tRNA synthetase